MPSVRVGAMRPMSSSGTLPPRRKRDSNRERGRHIPVHRDLPCRHGGCAHRRDRQMPGWTCTTGSRSSQGSHGGGGVHGRGSCVPRYACRVGEIQAQAGAKVYACRSLKVLGRVAITFTAQPIDLTSNKFPQICQCPHQWPCQMSAVDGRRRTLYDQYAYLVGQPQRRGNWSFCPLLLGGL